MNHIGSILTDRSPALMQHEQTSGVAKHTQRAHMTQQHNVLQFDVTDPDLRPKETETTGISSAPVAQASVLGADAVDTQKLSLMIAQMRLQLDAIEQLLTGLVPKATPTVAPQTIPTPPKPASFTEGVFNGTEMIGSDGETYPISPNYASKSKLVEGDLMKMTKAANGMLLFKQIGPIARKRMQGQILYDPRTNQWTALSEGRVYKILTASITFHKANEGDIAIIIVPEDGESAWAAIEHMTKQ
ncbi:MAG: hypothetical protein COU33_04595 [Candidatus Magasanikbacteria bacterium CG10_big_fil_rev_8_21_14_0_10_43_6]|uniref:50S ribosomal protein L7/L12 n=1 Tax=Candidatus Magasanikbacteria bacterium CG10_big_fil_rev_8_21_14_0_10_43_6 TaxID=1974650 RepID=A0A2M6W0E0_9BACT|nr:MAG: hypothetical protein COU33_04595 [Candidatus Magasanikbacteria bacterium CG10_big_fil_rev_8_21_14_0_10_43_6]